MGNRPLVPAIRGWKQGKTAELAAKNKPVNRTSIAVTLRKARGSSRMAIATDRMMRRLINGSDSGEVVAMT